MCTLDISKLKIYHDHYGFMQRMFKNKARIYYTHIDSLIYEVECNDTHEVMRQDAHKYFDTKVTFWDYDNKI